MDIDDKSLACLRSAILDSSYSRFQTVYLSFGIICGVLIAHEVIALSGDIMQRIAKVGESNAALSSYEADVNVSVLYPVLNAVRNEALLVAVVPGHLLEVKIKDKSIAGSGRGFDL